MMDLPVYLEPSGVKNCLADTSCHLPTIDCPWHTAKLEMPNVIQVITIAFTTKAIEVELNFILYILTSEV
jgi:hypothetical protein